MAKQKGLMTRVIEGIGAEFREDPLKFSISIAILLICVFLFFGAIEFSAEYDDKKIELKTKI